MALPFPVLAQRVSDNAVASAEDAFGTNVGVESTGIYTDSDTRGFSPVKAGNVRIDGVYFDPVGTLSGRLRQSTTIRVGASAQTYPFQAPTGIVDHKFRPRPTELGASVGLNFLGYGTFIRELDLRIPVTEGIGITAGGGWSLNKYGDGTWMKSWAAVFRPIVQTGGVEFAPFFSTGQFSFTAPHPLVVVNGDRLPTIPPVRRYLGQGWAGNSSTNAISGGTLKVQVTDAIYFRSGLFHGVADRKRNFSEIYSLQPDAVNARHLLIADPAQDLRSTSGEALVALRLSKGELRQRVFAGYRARDRLTETGGGFVRDYGTVRYGAADPRPEERFAFSRVNQGRVRQSSWMLGYTAEFDGVGLLNLGVQKARYRATLRDGRTGVLSTSRDDPWLYNATVGVQLSSSLLAFAATQKGLEDSGAAPENAANRNEQLPATRTTQYEAGLRWKFDGGQFVVNAFQITKPYFSFGPGDVFERVGQVRHRGVETSLAGHFGPRLNLLAGAVLMQPRVTGPGRDAGLVGVRPTGTPSIYSRLDANYRTDLLGLTATATVVHTGTRALGQRPLASLGGKQLMLPALTTVDLGVRRQFHVGKVPASLRVVVNNVLNERSWKIVAPNTMYVDDARKLSINLAADF